MRCATLSRMGADVTEDYRDGSMWGRYSSTSTHFDVVLDMIGGGWWGSCWYTSCCSLLGAVQSASQHGVLDVHVVGGGRRGSCCCTCCFLHLLLPLSIANGQPVTRLEVVVLSRTAGRAVSAARHMHMCPQPAFWCFRLIRRSSARRPLPAGSTTRDNMRVLKRGGHLVHVWTNAEK